MGRDVTVCVVDDDAAIAKVLCEGLKVCDYEAIEAHSGAEALEILGRGGIDLVLLDISMPEMDGYEVCRRIKSNPATADVPVIFVTVKGELDDIAKGYQLGATDYITKPFNLPMVMVRVEAALRAKRVREKTWMGNGYTDELTGLRNRRYLLERLQEEVDKAHRYNFPVSCVVFDVDDVEAIDDEIGPVSIDDLLAELAMALRNYTRTHDVLARYDDTRFAALLPHTPYEQALRYCTKILDEIDATTFSDPNFPTRASLSIGVVTCRNGTAKSAEYVLGEAMRYLLRAKSRPENRIAGRDLAEI